MLVNGSDGSIVFEGDAPKKPDKTTEQLLGDLEVGLDEAIEHAAYMQARSWLRDCAVCIIGDTLEVSIYDDRNTHVTLSLPLHLVLSSAAPDDRDYPDDDPDGVGATLRTVAILRQVAGELEQAAEQIKAGYKEP